MALISHGVHSSIESRKFFCTNISMAYTCTNVSGVGQVHMHHEVPLNLLCITNAIILPVNKDDYYARMIAYDH